MRICLAILSIVSLGFMTSCSENPSPPAIISMDLKDNSVKPGEINVVTITMNVGASDFNGGDRLSDPFSLIVLIPPGATFVPGTSVFPIQGLRPPNVVGTCSLGRTYLLYDFVRGEIDNSFDFKEFTDDLSFTLRLGLIANDLKVSARATELSPLDPCLPIDGDDVTLRVDA